MRLKNIKAEEFGCLKDWESPCIDKDIVVFLGMNESGKSTLFNLILTLLYGWRPASRESNPYIPWGGSKASCEGVFESNSGTTFTVGRRLMSKPEGVIACNDKERVIGNKAVESIESMPEEVFRDVFALDIDRLRFPDEKVWGKMQDRILGGQYASFLRPVREAAMDLENKANSLWRIDKRGTPKTKQLKTDLERLSGRLVEAEENENRLREIESELFNKNAELKSMLDNKTAKVCYLNKLERLLPVYKKLKSIEEMDKITSKIDGLDSLPEDAAGAFDDMERKKQALQKEIKGLEVQKEELKAAVDSYTPLQKAVFDCGDEIRDIIRCSSQTGIDLQSLNDLKMEISMLESQLHDRAGEFITGGWDDKYGPILAGIDEADLRSNIEYFKDVNSRYSEIKAGLMGLRGRSRNKKTPPLLYVISLLFTAVGALGLIIGKSIPISTVSGLVMVLGISIPVISLLLKSGNREAGDADGMQRNMRDIEEKMESARDNIRLMLCRIPVSVVRLETPDESLLMDINRLRDIVKSQEGLRKRLETVSQRLQKSKNTVNLLLMKCSIQDTGDIMRNITLLEKALLSAENIYRSAVQSNEALKDVDTSYENLCSEYNFLVEQEDNMVKSLDKLDGKGLKEKFDRLLEIRNIMDRERTLKSEIGFGTPEFQDVLDEIEELKSHGETWAFDENEYARAKTELAQVDTELNGLNEHIGSLKKELELLQKKDRPDDIKGEMEGIECEMQNIKVKRDRILLLRNLLLEADREYREEHQPDILQKAGEYIKIITGGCYDRLFMDEDGGERISVRRAGVRYPVGLDKPLSRGTKEQIYFALRLALIEHLDMKDEALPMFMDEAFVNWDNIRFENLVRVLEKIKSKRQIIIFTCHDYISEKLCNMAGAQIIRLG